MGRQTYNRNPQIVSAGSVVNNITNNYNYEFEWEVFPDGDGTPDVSGQPEYGNFKTGNTGATTITDFDNPNADGQFIRVLFTDGNTTIEHNANINLEGGVIGMPATYFTGGIGDILKFVYNPTTSKWEEDGRITKP